MEQHQPLQHPEIRLHYKGPGPQYGCFAKVATGPHAGRYGVYTATVLELDGTPEIITLRTRDEREDMLTVEYHDCRPADPGGR